MLYKAIVWRQEPDATGERLVIEAVSFDEAKAKLHARYSDRIVYSLWNEEEAAKPRE